MELSVIIVSYNVRHFLEQCLISVYKALEGIDSEVFVVDNNSTDGSCSMVGRRFPEARLIMNPENRGFSAANNQALKLATGRYLLLLNPDTLVEEETFKKCITFMDDHPDAGAAGVRMIDGKGRFLPESKRAIPTPGTAFFKISGLSRLFPHSGLFNRYYLGHLDNNSTAQADVISGAFMFIRREAFEKAGFLDEDYFMYGEDIDYSYRLIKSGFVNYYYPGAKIIHYKGESTKKENLNVLVNFYKAMLIFVRKHFNSGNERSYVFLVQTAIFFRAGLSLGKRVILFILPEFAYNPLKKEEKTVIISDSEGYSRIKELLELNPSGNIVSGRVSISPDDISAEVLGNLGQLKEVLRVNKVREVIFASRNVNTSLIIDSMHAIADSNVKIKIASSDEKYILGSRYVSTIDNPDSFNREYTGNRFIIWLKKLFNRKAVLPLDP
jgi:GT2 family glycosyltransferase